MQIILQIITLVSCCSNSFQNLSLSDKNQEKHSSVTNPTFESTTGDLNKKSTDETIKFQEKIEKLRNLCITQDNKFIDVLQIVLAYNYSFKLSCFKDRFKSNSKGNTEEQVKKESEEESEEESEKKSEEVSEEVSEEDSEEESEEESGEVSEEVAEEVSEEDSEEDSEEVSGEVSGEVSEEVAEEVSEEDSEEESRSSPFYQDLASTMISVNNRITFCLSRISMFNEGSIDEIQLKTHFKESKEIMLEHFNHAICEERIKEILEYLPTPPYEFKLEDIEKRRNTLLEMLDIYKAEIQEILDELEE